MCRMSSPGTYSRCWTNSTENPRNGDLWSPTRRPSTIERALIPSASARERTPGWRYSGMVLGGEFLGGRLDEPLDHVVHRDPLALGGEVHDQPVAEDRRGHGDHVVAGHVIRNPQGGVGLGGQDHVHARPRAGPPCAP